jgi:hypothetical protein
MVNGDVSPSNINPRAQDSSDAHWIFRAIAEPTTRKGFLDA